MSKEATQQLFLTSPYCKTKSNDKDTACPFDEDDVPTTTLEISDPGHILRLCECLTDRSTKRLEVKINKYLKYEAQADMVFMINLMNVSEEAVVNVVYDKILDCPRRTTLADDTFGNIIKYKDQCLKCAQSLDPKIQILIESVVPKDSGDLIIVPIVTKELRSNVPNRYAICPIYLICFLNSRKDSPYISRLVNETFRYCLTLLLNTREAEDERRMKQQCQSLLTVARKLFSHLGDLSDLLKEIMSEARRLTQAERCSLFLLDPDHMHLVAKVFDGISTHEKSHEVRIAKDQGIAGHVAVTGQMLNIKNAYKHPLFFKAIDEMTGFKTKNILCFPIRDEDKIVGVAQLCNKAVGHFDYFDEQVANAFSIYCGISIMHSLIYKRIRDAQARSQLANELMMYHMRVSDQDVADVLMCPCGHDYRNFGSFSFTPRSIMHREIPCLILKMFEELNFLNDFTIKKDILARFILYVKKGYRDLPYHNWLHAFSVAHFAYLCLKNFQLVEKGYLSKLEALAYMISCLCHDIDHRGTTNSFQQQSNSVLASLYSSEGSVMERHHLSQTICTLNTEGCNFLESLNREDYIKCLDLIKDMILATDLAIHYRIHSKQLAMAEDGYNSKIPEHRYFLCSLLMTCADLSDQTKDWPETKKVATMIYAEFFTQGDLEKKMGKEPANMMDREKASIPDHQLDFLTQCCICIFKILEMIFPQAKVLVEALKKNILCWEASKIIFERLALEGKDSYEVLISDELETQVQATLDVIQG